MAFNDYTVSFADYNRTFLPQLPRNAKNRSMDESRQATRTSSEEYGMFLIKDINVGRRTTTGFHVTNQTPDTTDAASRRLNLQNRSVVGRFGAQVAYIFVSWQSSVQSIGNWQLLNVYFPRSFKDKNKLQISQCVKVKGQEMPVIFIINNKKNSRVVFLRLLLLLHPHDIHFTKAMTLCSDVSLNDNNRSK